MPKGWHTRVKSTPLDKKAGPAVKFVFRYRPAGVFGFADFARRQGALGSESIGPSAILQAQGIVPSSASQDRTRSASQRKLGQGATSAEKRDRKPVKAEPGLRSARGDVSGDIIDISSDDEDVVSPVGRWWIEDLTVLNSWLSPS